MSPRKTKTRLSLVAAADRLEIHEHSFIVGKRGSLTHSHDGGGSPHKHVDGAIQTGPACYTIDKGDWLRSTGCTGGGRKEFTSKPTGPQLPLVVTEPSQIRVFIVGDGGASVAGEGCVGPGELPVARMVHRFKAQIASVTLLPGGPGVKRERKA